uniref:Uncharacterized protein n=1 Tax=Anguilla anguilla TaxID=7936 RepID=A0A0E9WCY4_ANGAN
MSCCKRPFSSSSCWICRFNSSRLEHSSSIHVTSSLLYVCNAAPCFVMVRSHNPGPEFSSVIFFTEEIVLPVAKQQFMFLFHTLTSFVLELTSVIFCNLHEHHDIPFFLTFTYFGFQG